MPIETVKNRGTMFVFSPDEWNLNVYVINGSEHTFVIDTALGYGSMSTVLIHAKQYGKPVVVINTHHHWDHIWGNGAFTGSSIIAHKHCTDLICKTWDTSFAQKKRYRDGETPICLPNLLFDSELYFPEDKIKLFYSPGHTADSISVLDEEDKVLIAGDNIGDTMDDLLPSLSCGIEQYRETLQRYKIMDFDTIVSGHNKVLHKDVIGSILKLC